MVRPPDETPRVAYNARSGHTGLRRGQEPQEVKLGPSPDGEGPGFALMSPANAADAVDQPGRSGPPLPAGAVGPGCGVGHPQQGLFVGPHVIVN